MTARTIAPRAGFDWTRVTWGKPSSPRSALCSYCSAGIGEDEVPLMLSSEQGHVAQFCDKCLVAWWGASETAPESGEDA